MDRLVLVTTSTEGQSIYLIENMLYLQQRKSISSQYNCCLIKYETESGIACFKNNY